MLSARTVPGVMEYAENIGVPQLLALRRRAADRDRGRCPNRAPDLPVDATAPDRGGAEDAEPDPQGFSARGRLHHRATAAVSGAHQGRATGRHTYDRCGRRAARRVAAARAARRIGPARCPRRQVETPRHPGLAADARKTRHRTPALYPVDAGE